MSKTKLPVAFLIAAAALATQVGCVTNPAQEAARPTHQEAANARSLAMSGTKLGNLAGLMYGYPVPPAQVRQAPNEPREYHIQETIPGHYRVSPVQ